MTKIEQVVENNHSFKISWIESNGEIIRYGLLKNSSEPMTSCLVFLNGRCEWIEKYQFLLSEIKFPKGTGFLTVDHRGQGGSSGHRSYIDGYHQFSEDIQNVINNLIPNTPYILMGHSMGGLISLFSTIEGYLNPQKLILCSPLLRFPDRPVPAILAKPLAKLLSRGPLKKIFTGGVYDNYSDFEDNNQTQWKEGYDKVVNRPWHQHAPTVSWVNSTFHACHQIFDEKKIATIKIPVHIFCPSHETVVNGSGSPDWTRKAKSLGVKVTQDFMQGGLHELVNEKKEIRSIITKYIENELAKMTSQEMNCI